MSHTSYTCTQSDDDEEGQHLSTYIIHIHTVMMMMRANTYLHTSYKNTQSDNDEGNNDDRMLSPFNATLIKNITRDFFFFLHSSQ